MGKNHRTPVQRWTVLLTCVFILPTGVLVVSGLPTVNNLVSRDDNRIEMDNKYITVEEKKYLKRRRKLAARWGFDVDVSTA